jgi:hypothetical protein
MVPRLATSPKINSFSVRLRPNPSASQQRTKMKPTPAIVLSTQ